MTFVLVNQISIIHISTVALNSKIFFYIMVEFICSGQRQYLRYLATKAKPALAKHSNKVFDQSYNAFVLICILSLTFPSFIIPLSFFNFLRMRTTLFFQMRLMICPLRVIRYRIFSHVKPLLTGTILVFFVFSIKPSASHFF